MVNGNLVRHSVNEFSRKKCLLCKQINKPKIKRFILLCMDSNFGLGQNQHENNKPDVRKIKKIK